jgi:hypothetical protein
MSVWRRCGPPGAALLVVLGLDLIAVAGCGPDSSRGKPRSSELCAARPSFCDRENLLAHHGRPATQGGEQLSRLCLRGGGHAYPPRILAGKDLEMLRSIRSQEFDALMKAVLARNKAAMRMRSKQPRRAWQVKTGSPTRFFPQKQLLLQQPCSQSLPLVFHNAPSSLLTQRTLVSECISEGYPRPGRRRRARDARRGAFHGGAGARGCGRRSV